jgi:purine operon repressor
LVSDSYIDKINIRLEAVNILRNIKEKFTYKELSKKTKIHPSILNRYIKGHLLPSYQRALEIISKFSTSTISDLENEIKLEISRKMVFNKAGFFNNSKLISDSSLLRKIGDLIRKKYSKLGINKIITAAVDGIPIATHVANSLNIPLVVGKYNKEIGVDEFYDSESTIESSGILMTMYVPKILLKRDDKVLLVDDIIRSGETQKLLIEIVKKAKAKIMGLLVIVALGNKWRKTIKPVQDFIFELLYQVE